MQNDEKPSGREVVGAILRFSPDGHRHVLEIAIEPPRVCELCGATEECRPYGPNGEQICLACGVKEP